MRKFYLHAGRFLCAAALLSSSLTLTTSCVDEVYDFEKELDLNVNLGGSLTLPLGSIAPITLSEMINAEDIDNFNDVDGLYTLSYSDSDSFSFDVEVGSIAIGGVDVEVGSIAIGGVDVEIPETDLDLSDLAETFVGDLSVVLSNPIINLEVSSSDLEVPIVITNFEAITMKDSQQIGALSLACTVEIPAVESGAETRVKVCIYDAETTISSPDPDVQYVTMAGLKSILQGMPDNITLSYTAQTKEDGAIYGDFSSATNTINIDYSLDVPLVFDSLSFEHEIVTDGLNEDILEIIDYITALEMELTVESTIPIQLEITDITPMDASGNSLKAELGSIVVDELGVIAANGTSTIKAALADSDEGDLSRLDGFTIGIKATATNENGDIELRSDQQLAISISAFLPEGVSVDFNDL
ncbi:MAG: hypothetical protein SNH73_08315 [Rikenellaceae bacterium]